MILYTTLNELKKHEPCTDGYRKLLKHIGLDYPVDQPIDLLTILKSNGLNDTIWSLRAAMPEADRDRISRLFACDCAEAVLPLYEEKYPNDNRPRKAIEVARRYALGQATKDELQEAYAYASASAYASWYASASAYASWYASASAYAYASWYAYASAERAKQTETLRNYLRGEK